MERGFATSGQGADGYVEDRRYALGEEGVLCLLSDSTNAEVPTFTNSEKVVGQSIMKIIEGIHGRIIFASFASNIFRLQQAAEAAVKTGRKIVVFGRSMEKAIVNGVELGYIKVPKGTIIDPSEMKNYHASEILILCTGSQGEPMAALARIANGMHRQVTLQPGDTVIFSSSPIPGNTTSVNRLINTIQEAGVDVIHGKINNIHTSGHGGQQEQKLMLRLIKPKFFMPVHGEYRHLKHHGDLAENLGMDKNNIFILETGNVLELTKNGCKKEGKVRTGAVFVDGLGVGDVGNIVLRDRRHLAQDGMLTIVVAIERETLSIVSGPDVITRGFVYVKESEELINKVKEISVIEVEKCLDIGVIEWYVLKSNVKKAVENYIYEKTKRRPTIIPIIMET